MRRTTHFFILILSFLQDILSNQIIYVASNPPCTYTCTGSSIAPYGNLLLALSKVPSYSSATILLLYDSSSPHYVFNEQSSSFDAPTSLWWSSFKDFHFTDLTIKPVFCDQEPAKSDPTLSSSCLASGEKMTVYMKTTNFRVLFSGTLLIQNIAFDAIEDISNLNTNPSQSIDLNDCLSSRMRCCEFGRSSSTVYPNSLVCDWHGDYSSLSLTPSKSLFEFASQPTSASLTLENVDLSNFLSPHLLSLVKTNEYPFTLVLNTVTIDYVYFSIGLIYHNPSITVNSPLLNTNSSHITIHNTVFSNYNPWDVQLQTINRIEGYLFYASGTFSGVFQAIASSFLNATSSIRNSCYSQNSPSYLLPMDNLLSKNRGSRSDMWLYYNSNYNPNSGSSLISMSQIYGAVDISNCKFQNIIGTSGSVLRVDDVLSSNTWFTIYGNIFDRNFAYDSFANIIIAKVSSPAFATVLDCPRVEVVNSSFINTYGCPGTYGNTLLLCPWFPDPRSIVINYALTATLKQKLIAWKLKSDTTSSVTIKDSLFENNILAISNSLAIIGSYFTIMENNILQGNGVLLLKSRRAVY